MSSGGVGPFFCSSVPRAWGGICFAGTRADIAGGGSRGDEGGAGQRRWLACCRASEGLASCVSSPPSLVPVPPAPSQGSATADRVVFSPSLSASLAPARVPPPSLVILCTNRYRLGRAHHTPYRYRPPPPWLGVLECCVGGGRFRSKRRHAHDPSFHLAFAAGIGVVCGDDGCVPPLSRPVRRALLPLVSPARMAWQRVRSPGRNKSIHRFEWRPLGVDILQRGVPSPSTDGHDSPLLLPGSGHSREMEPSPIHGHRDIKWAQDPATTNAPFGAMVDGSRVETLGSAFTRDGTLSNSTSLVVSKPRKNDRVGKNWPSQETVPELQMRSKNDQGKMPPPRLALAAEPAKRALAENDAHPATRTPRPSSLAPRPLLAIESSPLSLSWRQAVKTTARLCVPCTPHP